MPKKDTTGQSGAKKPAPKRKAADKKTKPKTKGKTSATAAARAKCMKARKKTKVRALRTKEAVVSLTPERTRKMMDAFDHKKSGKTYVEIGDAMGLSASFAHNLVQEADALLNDLSTDFRNLNIQRCESMIAKLWGSLHHKGTSVDTRVSCVNAIDKVIRTQTVLVTGAPMGSGGQAAVQGAFAQMLPAHAGGGGVEDAYRSYGGTEDIEDAAEIIEMQEGEIVDQA